MTMTLSISNQNFLGKYPRHFNLRETCCFPKYLSSLLLWSKGKRGELLWAVATHYELPGGLSEWNQELLSSSTVATRKSR